MSKVKSGVLSWRALNAVINTLTEDELKSALNYEICTEKRGTVMLRLHQRYEAVRSLRERAEMKEGRLL